MDGIWNFTFNGFCCVLSRGLYPLLASSFTLLVANSIQTDQQIRMKRPRIRYGRGGVVAGSITAASLLLLLPTTSQVHASPSSSSSSSSFPNFYTSSDIPNHNSNSNSNDQHSQSSNQGSASFRLAGDTSVRPQLAFDELEQDWSNAEIDALIRTSILTLPQPPPTPSYDPKDRLHICKQFIKSNLFVQQLLPSVLATLTASAMVCVLFASSNTTTGVSIYQPKTLLSTKVSAVYSVLLTTITVATLFFLHECLQYYSDTLQKCWRFQHSLDNLLAQVILASSRRSVFFQTGINSRLSSSAQVLLQEVCALVQLLHILVYASVVDDWKVLCSNRGLSRLLASKILKREHHQLLQNISMDKVQRWHIILNLLGTTIQQAQSSGGGGALQSNDSWSCVEPLAAVETSIQQLMHLVPTSQQSLPLSYLSWMQVLVNVMIFLTPLCRCVSFGHSCFVLTAVTLDDDSLTLSLLHYIYLLSFATLGMTGTILLSTMVCFILNGMLLVGLELLEPFSSSTSSSKINVGFFVANAKHRAQQQVQAAMYL